MCVIDVSGQRSAIFEADHSSSPLLKIAATFFDSTSSAAVSASARSLRSSSRSSSLMRCWSCRVACGLARASSGSASAAVALARHLSSSAGYTPCSRHHALLARLVHRRRRDHRLKPRRRSPCPLSGGPGLRLLTPALQCLRLPLRSPARPSSSFALSGGSNRATALFLECLSVSSHRSSHHRPQVQILSGRQLF